MSTPETSTRREAIVLECAPLAGGLLGAAATAIFVQLPSCGGEACPPDRVLMNIPLVLAMVIAALLFAANGVGWIAAGHPLIGCAMFFVRGYIAMFVYGWYLGESASDVTGQLAIVMFALSMTICAVSVTALAFYTRPRPARQAAGETSA